MHLDPELQSGLFITTTKDIYTCIYSNHVIIWQDHSCNYLYSKSLCLRSPNVRLGVKHNALLVFIQLYSGVYVEWLYRVNGRLITTDFIGSTHINKRNINHCLPKWKYCHATPALLWSLILIMPWRMECWTNKQKTEYEKQIRTNDILEA